MSHRLLENGTGDFVVHCKYVTESTKQILGDGFFSVVKPCRNIITNKVFAMKIIAKSTIKNKLHFVSREISILQKVDSDVREHENGRKKSSRDVFHGHHHVLQLFDFFETVDSIVLITQLCDRNDLYELIIKNDVLDLDRQVRPFTACLISAIEFLHSHGIVHRDIKAENILFRNRTFGLWFLQGENQYDMLAHDLIIADFGLALDKSVSNSDCFKEFVGTLSYVSPEIIKCRDVSILGTEKAKLVAEYDDPVDIWALGVLVYFMAFGYMPFDCETDEETLLCISKCDFYYEGDQKKDPKLKDLWNFIETCFESDQKMRASAKILKQHPLVSTYFPSSHKTNQKLYPALNFDKKIDPTKTLQKESPFVHPAVHSIKTPTKVVSMNSISNLEEVPTDTKKQKKPHNSLSKKSASTVSIAQYQETTVQSNDKISEKLLNKSYSMMTLNNINSNSHKLSTFQLQPSAPIHALMNGSLSTQPEPKITLQTAGSATSVKTSGISLLSLNGSPSGSVTSADSAEKRKSNGKPYN